MNSTNYTGEDHLIPVLINDTVHCLRFFPSKDINYLASGGWDSKLRLFEINYQITSQNSVQDFVKISSAQKDECQNSGPIVSLEWKGSSGAIITGCMDGSINYIDFQKKISQKIGEHQGGTMSVLYLSKYDVIITGGLDGVIKIWDLKNKDPVVSYKFWNKIYSMSYAKNLLVISLSENLISYFNLDNLQKNKFEPELIYYSHIRTSQIKRVAVMNEGNCYLEGSAEGRIAVKFINFYSKPPIKTTDGTFEILSEKDYAFRTHRELKTIGTDKVVQTYPVNDLRVNPVYGSVVSAGGNGKYYIWDIENKSKICERENCEDKTPITAADFNLNGNLLAYASGYDWSRGAQFAHLYTRPKIFIHYLQPNHRKGKK